MNRKYGARSIASLIGIHPDLRRVIDAALQDSPLDFIVIEGLRTIGRQKQLVAQGFSKTMNSRHITGHAVDLLPIGPNGKGSFDWKLYHVLGPAVEDAARKVGVAIVWGGRWKSFRDGPHFELERNAYPANAWTTGMAAPRYTKPSAPVPEVMLPQPAPPVAPKPRLAPAPALEPAPAPAPVPAPRNWLSRMFLALAEFSNRR